MTVQERKVLAALLVAARTNGYTILSIDDGGDEDVTTGLDTDAAVIDTASAVDSSTVRFRNHKGARVGFMLVFGNSPDGSELIADYTASPDGDKIVRETENAALR